MKAVGLGSAGLVCAVAIAMWSPPASAEGKRLSLPADGLQSLRIEADEGFLHIKAVPGLETIEVDAEIHGRERPHRLSLEKHGDAALLVADIIDLRFFDMNSRIDVTVRIPDRLALDIEDDSGAIEVSGTRADMKIEDDSGDILVRDHRGALTIRDDSGDIQLQEIVGAVKIDDDSGVMNLASITGNVSIRDDSGGIRISDVTGHVSISDDSGGITAANITQGLTIERDGSGGVTTTNIQGGVEIRR